MGGLMLALMETLADFGTMAVFNYDTFTTAIYKTWFGLFSLSGASQLASVLVLLVFALILLEQLSRSRLRYTQSGRHSAVPNAFACRTGAASWPPLSPRRCC